MSSIAGGSASAVLRKHIEAQKAVAGQQQAAGILNPVGQQQQQQQLNQQLLHRISGQKAEPSQPHVKTESGGNAARNIGSITPTTTIAPTVPTSPTKSSGPVGGDPIILSDSEDEMPESLAVTSALKSVNPAPTTSSSATPTSSQTVVNSASTSQVVHAPPAATSQASSSGSLAMSDTDNGGVDLWKVGDGISTYVNTHLIPLISICQNDETI